MSESDEVPMKRSLAAIGHESSMPLVVQPELRRAGNVQGDRLENNEVILGCEAKFSIFHAA